MVASGIGIGMGIYTGRHLSWWKVYTFSRLLRYLASLLRYQALTGPELLRRATIYPEFVRLGVDTCTSLGKLPVPSCLRGAVQQETRQELIRLGEKNREVACTILERLATLWEEEARQKYNEAEAARHLCPRLGACAGLLAAILIG